MKALACLLLLLLSVDGYTQTDTLQNRMLSPADLQADFRYFRQLLEETHPGLYRYTPKPVMQARLDSLAGSLNQPLSVFGFYRIISGLIADIRCAHTHALPSKAWQTLFAQRWKTLPFFMFPIDGKSYILFNGTADQRIRPGFELLSINGQPIQEIQQIMYRYHWSDGYIQTSKDASLQGQLFALFYYWFIGQPDTYALTFRSLTGDTIRVEVPAEPFATSLKMMKKNPVNKQMMAWYNRRKPKTPWRISFPDDVPQTAYLRIDSFGGGKDSDEAAARFRAFMDKSLATMKTKNVRHLIVDLRSNPGGWDVQGVELFTYLAKADTAVRYYHRHHTVTDSSSFLRFSDIPADALKSIKQQLIPEKDGTFTEVADDDSWELRPQLPKPNRFSGQVYILMDGRSGSTTAEFLAVAHAHRIGTFIGTESGGAYEGGNGGSFINLALPKSRIQVTTPLVYYTNGVGKPDQPGRGTLPDYSLPLQIDNVLNHTDSQLDLAKKLIREQSPGTAGHTSK
ncbi:S41 family peptidase [Spirosoma sp. 209]|uniref:S41 family peptidase n=1 Tax=Spirosoma sp. 209 TaxID=1955701 RepID=UPI00098D18DF|nr:S41 family peptidase [Spirosoma sp. 209]